MLADLCGLTDLPPRNLIDSEPHVTVGHAFIRQCFPFQVSCRGIRFSIVHSFIFSFLSVEKWTCRWGFVSEGQRSGSRKGFQEGPPLPEDASQEKLRLL